MCQSLFGVLQHSKLTEALKAPIPAPFVRASSAAGRNDLLSVHHSRVIITGCTDLPIPSSFSRDRYIFPLNFLERLFSIFRFVFLEVGDWAKRSRSFVTPLLPHSIVTGRVTVSWLPAARL